MSPSCKVGALSFLPSFLHLVMEFDGVPVTGVQLTAKDPLLLLLRQFGIQRLCQVLALLVQVPEVAHVRLQQ